MTNSIINSIILHQCFCVVYIIKIEVDLIRRNKQQLIQNLIPFYINT